MVVGLMYPPLCKLGFEMPHSAGECYSLQSRRYEASPLSAYVWSTVTWAPYADFVLTRGV